MIERHPAGDRAAWLDLRRRDITASAAAGLLSLHDYHTPFSIWAHKTGRVSDDVEDTPALVRGRLLEPVAVQLLAQDHPDWRLEHNSGAAQVYLRDPAARLGATVDVFATDPERGPGIVQIKSVDPFAFRAKWEQDGEVTPPLWIAVQALIEAHLAGAEWAAVAALKVGSGLEMHLVDVPLHAGVIYRVREKVAEFWAMVEAGREPPPDYGRDAGIIEALYGQDDGSEVDLTGDELLPALLDERARLSAEKGQAEKRLREIKAEVLAKVGPHQRALVAGGRTITAKTINRGAYTVEASAYRDIRVREPQW